MPRPWRLRYANAKYHVTVRGNGRETVFFEPKDYARFLDQLDAALEADEVILYAYVLMPNHYHLFAETPLGNIQKFMQRLNTAYGMYCRFKHNRPGHCFQGRYGAKLVQGDQYIVGLIRYIHLNPVKGQRMRSVPAVRKREILRMFPYSSHAGYAGICKPETRIDYRWLRVMGRRTDKGNREAYRGFIDRMIMKDDDALLKDMGQSQYAIGDERFREASEGELKEKRLERGVTGDIVWPEDHRPSVEAVAKEAMKVLRVRMEDVRCHGNRLGDRKALIVEWCCRWSEASQREVGRYLGYGSDSAVGKARQKARMVLREPHYIRAGEKVERRLSVQTTCHGGS